MVTNIPQLFPRTIYQPATGNVVGQRSGDSPRKDGDFSPPLHRVSYWIAVVAQQELSFGDLVKLLEDMLANR